MNDNDIIKALECCVGKSLKRYLCLKCPLRDRDCYGGALLMPAVLELINRQKAEIERLQKYNTDVSRKHYNDGIKEFEEKLKEKAFYVQEPEWDGCVVDCNDIIGFAKEMTEGEDGNL